MDLALPLTEFGRQDQDTSNGGNKPNEKEWLRNESMLAKRNLNRVQQLDHQEDQQDGVEQDHDIRGERVAGDVLDERDGSVDEENESTRPQEQPKPGVDDIFDCDKRTGNPCTSWRL